MQSKKTNEMTELRKILGANMKAFRAEFGYSQAKLAELVDTATNYIAQIENGKRFPTDKMLEKIAIALNRKGYELFCTENFEKIEVKEWKTQVLSDIEHFINERISRINVRISADLNTKT